MIKTKYNNEINKIWVEVIKPTIFQFSEELGINKKDDYIIEKKVKKIYNQQKRYFVESYMSPDSPNIDRHKIAACLVKTIMIVKPLRIPISKKIEFVFSKKPLYRIVSANLTDKDYKYLLLANEYLAISVATSVIDGFIAISDNNKRLKHKICLPNPFPEEDDDYLLDLCACLYYTKPKRINTITLSNIFFLLEKYSCRKIQCENLDKVLSKELSKKLVIEEFEINKMVSDIRLGIITDINI